MADEHLEKFWIFFLHRLFLQLFINDVNNYSLAMSTNMHRRCQQLFLSDCRWFRSLEKYSEIFHCVGCWNNFALRHQRSNYIHQKDSCLAICNGGARSSTLFWCSSTTDSTNIFWWPMISCLREIFEFSSCIGSSFNYSSAMWTTIHRRCEQLFIGDVNNYSSPIADDFVPYKFFWKSFPASAVETTFFCGIGGRGSICRKDSCLVIQNSGIRSSNLFRCSHQTFHRVGNLII